MYKNLRAEMVRHSVSVGDVARELGVTTRTVYSKLNGHQDWTLGEAFKVVTLLNSKGGNYTIDSKDTGLFVV